MSENFNETISKCRMENLRQRGFDDVIARPDAQRRYAPMATK
jgi:hypothetical protein